MLCFMSRLRSNVYGSGLKFTVQNCLGNELNVQNLHKHKSKQTFISVRIKKKDYLLMSAYFLAYSEEKCQLFCIARVTRHGQDVCFVVNIRLVNLDRCVIHMRFQNAVCT